MLNLKKALQVYDSVSLQKLVWILMENLVLVQKYIKYQAIKLIIYIKFLE